MCTYFISFSKTTASPGLARGVLDQVFEFYRNFAWMLCLKIWVFIVMFRDDRKSRYKLIEAQNPDHTSEPHHGFIWVGEFLLMRSPRPAHRCIFPAAQLRFDCTLWGLRNFFEDRWRHVVPPHGFYYCPLYSPYFVVCDGTHVHI